MASVPAHAFDDLFVRPATSLAAECRNGLVEYRIAEWRRRDRPAVKEFRSVEQIMEDVNPAPLRALRARGCSNAYVDVFRACTQVDWPEDLRSAWPPIGKSAQTVPEMTKVIADCLKALETRGLSPARAR